MEIPRFWVRNEEDVTVDDGRALHLVAWGWSGSNQEEASGMARERLLRLVGRVRNREPLPQNPAYLYGNRPLREEIIQEISGSSGEVEAVITRNSYGSLVLNTANVLFIDIDLADEPKRGGFLSGLMGKTKPDPIAERVERIKQQLRSTGGSFRIYRTAAGLRVLGTDPLYQPADPAAEKLMNSVGADLSFVQLCRVQKSFRARLTPKPWRCGLNTPPGSYPREDGQLRHRFEEWIASYDARCSSHATCRLLDQVGFGRVQDQAARVLEIHDANTRVAKDSLPLA